MRTTSLNYPVIMIHCNVGIQRSSSCKTSYLHNVIASKPCASRCPQAFIPCRLHESRAASANLRGLLTSKRCDQRGLILMCASGQPASSEIGSAAPNDPALFWKSHISSSPTLKLSIDDCITEIIPRRKARTVPVQPTLAIVFVSSAYADSYWQLVPLLRQRLPSLKTIVGCSVSVTCQQVQGQSRGLPAG